MGLAQECVEYGVGSLMMQTCQNNLGFTLYSMLSVYYMVVISENWIEPEVRVSTDVGVLLLNIGDQVQ